MAGAWIGLISSLAGSAMTSNALSGGRSDIKNLAKYRPYSGLGPWGLTRFTNGGYNIMESDPTAMERSMLNAQGMYQMGGGLFNDPNFQQAWGGNDILGSLQGAQGANSMFVDPTGYDPSGYAGNLFNTGQSLINQSGDLSGLIQSNLDASRALAAPQEQQIANNFFNREFMNTMGATSGAGLRRFDQGMAAQLRDEQRVLNAQQLGLGAQSQLLNAGLGAYGQGAGMLGQGFNQSLQSLGQYQTAGQNRLQNAMGLFGLGSNTYQGALGMGSQFANQNLQRDQFYGNFITGLLNAAANRIGATQGHAQGLGQMAADKGGLMGGIMSGIGSYFS